MEPPDNKQVPPLQAQLRRGYLGDDHDLFRTSSSLDIKFPFHQSHLLPPSSSVRGGSLKLFPRENTQAHETLVSDPRFSLQEFDDKRYKGHYAYPGVPGIVQNYSSGLASLSHLQNGLNNPNSALMYHSTGAGASTHNHMVEHSYNAVPFVFKDKSGLVPQIPPLHIQHEFSRRDDKDLNENSTDVIRSKCSRCKKSFVQRLVKATAAGKVKSEPKVYKLCLHCRDLQRQRSRRWQKKTKDKQGACRRCGGEIPVDQQRFVLCPSCRKSLRVRKANRAAQGRCVHCSGPIAASIVSENIDADPEPHGHAESHDDSDARSSSVGSGGTYKVCQRCRENDKIRRANLESMGKCNRCAKSLTSEDHGKHKVCFPCRQKKKKVGPSLLYSSKNAPIKAESHSALPSISSQSAQNSHQGQRLQGPQQLPSYSIESDQSARPPSSREQQSSDIPQNVMVPSINYMPTEQGNMLVQSGINGTCNMSQHPHPQPQPQPQQQQELPIGYNSLIQQMQPVMQNASDLYKPPMAQLPQLQPHVDLGYQQYIGYPPINCNGLSYTEGRMGG